MKGRPAVGLIGYLRGFSLPLVVFLLIYPLLLSLDVFEADTLWHLKAGEWTVEHGAIPRVDPFSYTKRGEPWVAHGWLAEVIIYGAYSIGGWGGLRVLAASAFSLAVAGLIRLLLLRGCSPYLALIGGMVALSVCNGHYLVRPHVLAWPLLILWASWQAQAGESGRPPPRWTVVMLAIWANLHGGFTVGLALTGFACFEALLLAWKQNEWRAALSAWLPYLLLASLAALVTPQGIDGILLTWNVLGMKVATEYIAEWAQPNFHSFQPFEVWLLLLLITAGLRPLAVSWPRWLWLAGIVHLGLRYGRSMEFFGLLFPLYFGKAFDSAWVRPSGNAINKVLAKLSTRSSGVAKLSAICVFALVSAIAVHKSQPPKDGSFQVSGLLGAALGGARGNVLNDYYYGGFLVWSGISPFIDGRTDIYGDDFFSRYVDAVVLGKADKLRSLLEEYDIGWTLLGANNVAVSLLDCWKGWRRVYSDRSVVVHVRE